ncbi:MAG: putative component of type VI protein secretion system [Marinobacter maritimus]|jgi:predicted component of type VI protein secretion system|uniref:hypothetical protein n=1 Tax=Marinobacter maritimus TaxID=277961 RepID=UPI001ED102D3|nr:hypothetical protein [Marinobacter maritimus]MBL1273444.1 hypothetical protein [Oceanospirillales bacterium]|tara:strand:- start:156 stop:404 length:249 start_codon:yes stop_codon:yes gene_type:complete
MMKLTIQFAGLGFMALALTGCFDGSSSNSSQSQPPAMSVDFGAFVKGEFDNPDPNREPRKINAVTFSFNDQDDPQAFDDLLR